MDNELKIKHCMELIERFYSIDNLIFGQAKMCAIYSLIETMKWTKDEDTLSYLASVRFMLSDITFYDYDQYKNRQYNKSTA